MKIINKLIDNIRNFKYKSLYAKMLWVYSLIFTTGIIIVGVFSYMRASHSILNKINSVNYGVLNQTMKTVDFKTEKIEYLTMNLIMDPILKDEFDSLTMEEKMFMSQEFFQKFPMEDYIESICIYYPNSNTLVSSLDGVINTEYSIDIDWMKYVNENKVAGYNTNYIDNGQDRLVSIREFPILSKIKIGYVIVNINKSKLFKEVEALTDNGQQLFVYDKNNNIVYGDKESFENILDNNFSKLDTSKNDDIVLKRGRKKYSAIMITSRSNGWKYINVVDMNYLNKDLNQTKNFTCFLIIACLVLGVLFSRRVIHKFYTPIMTLTNKVISSKHKLNITEDVFVANDIELLDVMIDKIIASKDNIDEFAEKSKNAILQGMLLNLCYGDVNTEDLDFIEALLKERGFNIEDLFFAAIVIQIEKHSKQDNTNSQIRTLFNNYDFDVHNCSMVITYMDDDKIVGMISNNGSEKDVVDVSYAIKDILLKNAGIVATVAVGNIYDDLVNFNLSFNEALDALDYRVMSGVGSVIQISDLADIGSMPKYYYPLSKEVELMEKIKFCDLEGALKIVDEIHTTIPSTVGKYAKELLWQLMNGAFRSISSRGILYDDIFGKSFFDSYIEYSNIDNMNDMLRYVKAQICTIIEFLQNKRKINNDVVVEKIKAYIDENYGTDMCLDDIAEVTGLSSAYVSTIFKNTMGVGFAEYLRDVRIDKSKALLINTDLNIDTVASKVGYVNTRSFFRTFKNKTSITPSEYRKRGELI